MTNPLTGAGLGFRRELIPDLLQAVPESIDFFEIAPENWAGMGGRSARDLRQITEQRPFVCHGLSLNLGGPAPLDKSLLHRIKGFMSQHGMTLYTEHLSWCAADSQLYELLPLPLSEAAARWTAERISRAQDILGMRIGIENASTYFEPPAGEMSEPEFIRRVLELADCSLHLDINNLYVNSCNFGFNPISYLQALPLERVCYLHVAGHYTEDDGLIIDTHGSHVCDPVWSLLSACYQRIGGNHPTCLERDFNLPPLAELVREVEQIRHLQKQAPRHLRKAA